MSTLQIVDGNTAAADVAYRTCEIFAIYPITPSSTMGELVDKWAAEKIPNIFDTIPLVAEMQSEGGASAAVHGALQAGALTSTFTSSQGLLLMIPSMYKIAGELTPVVFHVAARPLATHALSIFGDHSDVMAVRSTGFALLSSAGVQESHDMALIAQAATLESRVPFLHFFDGFRTSHELKKIQVLTNDQMRQMIDESLVLAHRARRLHPETPFIRGTSHNPDTYFQARETINNYYTAVPAILEKAFRKFESITGRSYHDVEYFGDPTAERIIIVMGSAVEVTRETVKYLNKSNEKVGILQVRLYRPFPSENLINAIPKTVKTIAVLDRTREPGAIGEPLYQDVISAYGEARQNKKVDFIPVIVGGRYGLSSKDFSPAMAKAVFDEIKKSTPKHNFSVGIEDDVTHTSLPFDPTFNSEPASVTSALFYGLGSDGTVSANKNSIKIIGESTNLHTQGYFVYDSKKAGARTISHLRFGPEPIDSAYLIEHADFIACHQSQFLLQIDILKHAKNNATFLLNSPYSAKEVWNHLPRIVQDHIIQKKLKFYVINAYEIAHMLGLGSRINTIMQTCFFHISHIIPADKAIEAIKKAIIKTYQYKGEKVVQMNLDAVDKTIALLELVNVPDKSTSQITFESAITDDAPEYVKRVVLPILRDEGDKIPVSAFPCDGTYPSATTRWEKRNIAQEIPEWDAETCIQCGICSLVCPHAVLRARRYPESALKNQPEHFHSAKYKADKNSTDRFTIQCYIEDCTECGVCVHNCPAKRKSDPNKKALAMIPKEPILEQERKNIAFFETLPHDESSAKDSAAVRDIQFLHPMFEFSGACAGCGETPYLQLVSKLFGDRAVMSNATGCSSIYGGNLPTTPWSTNNLGRGPAWCNSLFEDNAEFGFGLRLSEDKNNEHAKELLTALAPSLDAKLVDELLHAPQKTDADIRATRDRIATLKEKLKAISDPRARRLLSMADFLLNHSVWIIGGDGWAYDIGYGGLDHVLACGRNVNVLVLDTQVYSNTGGQASKATPKGAVAKFASDGKKTPKKELGLMNMSYGYVYVAQVALGANPAQAIKAFIEAESYNGPSIIIAYSHCVAHGYDMVQGINQQKLAVQSGFWPLYRYNPELVSIGKNPFQLDSKAPTIPVADYRKNEMRYVFLEKTHPEEAKRLLQETQVEIERRWKILEKMAS